MHFGLWQRDRAAEVTLGDAERADEIPFGFTIGFEVDSVPESAEAVADTGLTLIQGPKTEAWGQTTSRFFTLSGALCEFSETPGARTAVGHLEN